MPHLALLFRGEDTTLGQAGVCRACRRHMPDGPDCCLGLLPGVSHACCGHGNARRAYVVFGGEPDQDARTIPDRVTLRGRDALFYFKFAGRDVAVAQDAR